MQKVVNNILDKKLVNNDKHLCDKISSYLEYICDDCGCDLFNKNPVNSEDRYLCEKCVHSYCFCTIKKCDKMESWREILIQSRQYVIPIDWKCDEHRA